MERSGCSRGWFGFRTLPSPRGAASPIESGPSGRIPQLAPDLVVEVLSKGNTKPEMARKLREYFEAGVRLVWMVDIRKRTVRVHTAVDQSVLIKEGEVFDGDCAARVRASTGRAVRER